MKKTILRTCVLTREKLEKKSLFRIVRNKEGLIFVDETLKANGRGCYLKKDASVIESAKIKKVLDRVFETKVNDDIYNELINKL